MSTGTMEKLDSKEIIVAPFAVEATHPRMCDLLMQCIPGVRLRSRTNGQSGMVNVHGDFTVPQDQARHLASLPVIPGLILALDPAQCKYSVTDPLVEEKNEDLRQRLARWINQNTSNKVEKITGMPKKVGQLDMHQMKSAVREVYRMLEAKEVTLVHGSPLLDMEDIDRLPGKYLLNPGMVSSTTQPRYEDDFPGWVDRLSHSGG